MSFGDRIQARKAEKKHIQGLIVKTKDYPVIAAFEDRYGINAELKELQYAYIHRSDLKPSAKPQTHNDQKPSDTSNIKYSLKGPPQVSDKEYEPKLIVEAIKDIKKGYFSYNLSNRISNLLNKSFVEKMLEYIDASGEKDSVIYNRVNIDRRLYSKIVSDYSYTPSKDTCIMICIALRLSLDEAQDLIARCGYIFSHSIDRDMVIECMIDQGEYDINIINLVLDSMKMKPLGRNSK